MKSLRRRPALPACPTFCSISPSPDGSWRNRTGALCNMLLQEKRSCFQPLSDLCCSESQTGSHKYLGEPSQCGATQWPPSSSCHPPFFCTFSFSYTNFSFSSLLFFHFVTFSYSFFFFFLPQYVSFSLFHNAPSSWVSS